MTGAAKTVLKSAVIRAGLEGLHIAERVGLAGTPHVRSVIFTLHHVRPASRRSFAPNAHLEITPHFLDTAITALKADGFEPVALCDLPARMAGAADGARFFAFTLDDGYRNNRDHALPVFRKHAVPFTVFVTRGFVERRQSLWWETAADLIAHVPQLSFDFGQGRGVEIVPTGTHGEKCRAFERLAATIRSQEQDRFIAELDDAALSAGIDPLTIVDHEVMDAGELRNFSDDPLVSLGAHTLTHPSLAHVADDRLENEMACSAEFVSAITGQATESFAYPYGDAHAAGPREYAAAAKAGFRLAVTTQPGTIDRTMLEREPTALKRISLNGHYQKARYVRALASGLAFKFV
ncbi:polysaccharide deacetylase family protein [Pararhizobium haloflavum]|uniref:polysaccharide deacetylase family protein n=1 Tax=Pararhizobium haloflavum TaxID=2037914 RepID=UPI000C1A7E69|nr:polysaccharide deacetylase family protein [Pararhizobium haloflavum]